MAAERASRLKFGLPVPGGLASARPFQQATLFAAALLVAAAALVAGLGGQSDDLAFAAAIAAFSIFVPVGIGVLWWRRRPASRIGSWLVAMGGLTALYSLANAGEPLLYAVGMAAEPLLTGLVFVLLIGFPTGRIAGRYERVFLVLAALAVAILYLPVLLGSPNVHSRYSAYDCVTCPANPLQVWTVPDATLAALTAFGSIALAGAAMAVTVEVVRRTLAATGPRRRMLAAVCCTSLLLVPATALHAVAGVVLAPGDEILIMTSIAVVGLWFLFPLGFAVPLVVEEAVAATRLSRLLGELSDARLRDGWRDRLRLAVDDPELELGLWDEQSGSYLDRAGAVVDRASLHEEQLWFEVDDEGRRLAVLIVDKSLEDGPEVMVAAALATAAAVEADRMESVRRDLLGRAATAAVFERSRMARTVQAGAQQRLAAMRVSVNLAAEGRGYAEQDDFLSLVAAQLDAAIKELRDVVWAGGSATISRRGLGPALRSITRAAPMRVQVLDRGLHRSHPQTELAVYYCCLEAIQNAIKHAGRDEMVTVRLTDAPQGGIAFSVTDGGPGFDVASERSGLGLQSMRDRVEALGGWLLVTSRIGRGTLVSGWVPNASSLPHFDRT